MAAGSNSLRVVASRLRVIDRTAREALPRLADFYLVHIVTARTLRCVAAAHRAREIAREMRALISGRPIRRDDLASTVAFVVRSRKPSLRTPIYPEEDAGRRGTLAQLQRKLAPTSALVVPVLRNGDVVGTLSLCYSESGRSHAAHDVPRAQRLAGRIAQALANPSDAASRLRPTARHARQGTTLRRRVGARN